MSTPQQYQASLDPEKRSHAHSFAIVISLILLSEVSSFEYNMVSPALPDIAAAFGTKQVGLMFTVLLVSGASLLPLLGKLADIVGKRRVLLAGMSIMAIGCLICAFAPTFPIMLIGRGMQAFGMVGLTLTYGLVRDLIPRRYVPIAIGTIGMGVGLAGIVGPVVGGLLVDNIGYHAIFLFLAGYIVVMGLLVAVVVPETPVRRRHKLDVPGALLLGVGVGLVCAAATGVGIPWLQAILGVAALIAFVLVERKVPEPLLAFELLRRPPVWGTLVIAICIGFIINSNVALISQMVRSVPVPGVDSGLGLSATNFSLAYALPLGILGTISGFSAGLIARRWGPKYSMIGSAACWTIGTTIVALGLMQSVTALVVVAFLFGLGNGSYHASASNLIVEAVPASFQGIGASMKATGEQIAGAFGTAITSAIIVGSIIGSDPTTKALSYDMGGFRISYWIYAVVAAIALVTTILLKHGNKPATGGDVAEIGEVTSPAPAK